MSNSSEQSMFYESERLQSFAGWNNGNVTVERLARFGFFWPPASREINSDYVTCVFCSVVVGDWAPGDCVAFDHLRWSPNCPLLRHAPTANAALDYALLFNGLWQLEHPMPNDSGRYFVVDSTSGPDAPTPRDGEPEHFSEAEIAAENHMQRRVGVDEVGSTLEDAADDAAWQADIDALPINSYRFLQNQRRCENNKWVVYHPNYKKYSEFAKRLTTFALWPLALRKINNAENLSECGFIYTNVSDELKCFSCAHVFSNWIGQDAWETHAFYSPFCKYLLLAKGKKYVNECQIKMTKFFSLDENDENRTSDELKATKNDKEETEKSTIESSINDVEFNKLCSICFDEVVTSIFIPCGHITCCFKCAAAMDNCPICREEFTGVYKFYF